MAFDFLNRIASKVTSAISSAIHRAESTLSSDRKTDTDADMSSSVSGLQSVQGRLKGIADSFQDHIVPQIIVSEIARETRDTIRELLEPISRTGNLKRSMEWHELGSGMADVTTTSDYAEKIEEGDFDVPEIDELLEWMTNKSEFSGKSFKERRRIAFAIQYSMEKKKNEGVSGNSTLRKISPTHNRKYPFVDIAVERMEPKIQSAGDVVANIIRKI